MKRLRLKRGGDNVKDLKVKTNRALGQPSAKQITAELAIIFGVIILGVGSFLWWHYIESNPQRVFKGMLNTALQTTSGVQHITESQGVQSLNQTTTFQTKGQHLAKSFSTLHQADSLATTETLSTPQQDLNRFTDVKTTQLGSDGKPVDFAKVKNIWAINTQDTGNTSALYFGATSGVIPFASLPADQRQVVMALMDKTYDVNYQSMQRKIVDHRPQYTYTVTLEPQAYFKMLKQLAKDKGITQYDRINPKDYAGYALLQFKVTVDVWSRQLVGINYTTSNRREEFSQFGRQQPPTELPKTQLTLDQLLSRIQSIQ